MTNNSQLALRADLRLTRDIKHVNYLLAVRDSANTVSLQLSRDVQEGVLEELIWTDAKLNMLQSKGQLTREIEAKIDWELQRFMEEVGHRMAHAYVAIMDVVRQASHERPISQMEAVVRACRLLVESN